MIFLSHNKNDKPIVEPIAIRLSSIFGVEKVFYDSWSIQPGDGIIDKMNDGLEKVKYFFLFVSANSIDSNMVKLEWQSALMKATKGNCKIIPIRMDATLMPAILTQTVYLDMYSNGLEVTLKQMIDVINGDNIFYPQYTNFSNIEALVEENKTIKITIGAKYFMEPTSMYLLCTKNSEEELSYQVQSDSICECGFNSSIKLNNGEVYNCIFINVFRATTPQNPVVILLSPKKEGKIKVDIIMKGENNHDFHSIPIERV